MESYKIGFKNEIIWDIYWFSLFVFFDQLLVSSIAFPKTATESN